MTDYSADCLIIGAGPAGLGAALYAARDRFKTIILEKFYPGGQILTTDRIENYPGYVNISGPDLVLKMVEQVQSFGAEIKSGQEAVHLQRRPDGLIEVRTSRDTYWSKVVILAPGSSYRKLGVPGEEEFRQAGSGVSYCGTCDAPFFKDKVVVAVGGGNTAVEETLHLSKYVRTVYLVHRRSEFRASKILVEELMQKAAQKDSNIRLKLNTILTEIKGSSKVEKVLLKNVQTGQMEELPCDGVFIFVGMVPNTAFLKGFADLTETGFIRCEPACLRTAVPGVFAAGDCRIGAAMQLVTAVADGVNAAIWMKHYLRDPQWWHQPLTEALHST
ncbi:MAG TPA: FAD-dependent oxidoreductase [Anaerohalosphaeraceae bacterium]|jgi:thioredoxin reductase (NADPH)|nr:FAD-dependent oxidoreductase [Anaerohalosphaeraceae bacterium]HPB93175.1 FAD-dependent oxidoreductase [Anaerohalosphaeraceae bacterium]HRT22566.1 FAD-dependent oxidoreductase [Anaerohalosphaeraceae bacterium]HRU14265.1 FAD-dependent oxidoreductase [Anaerohalosphaeraceae bacterium]